MQNEPSDTILFLEGQEQIGKEAWENKLEGCKLILFIGDLEYGTDIQS